MKEFNFLKRRKKRAKKEVEVERQGFLKQLFKERLQNSRKRKHIVTVGIVYEDKVIRKFNVTTRDFSKKLALKKIQREMSLKVIDAKQSKKK